MPNLVLTAAALLLRNPSSAHTADMQHEMHARTRSRDENRRLRASRTTKRA